MKSNKGEWGYFRKEKRRKILFTLILLAIPLFILFTSEAYFGTRQNILTIVAMVGLIPFAMSLVNLIVLFMHKSLPDEEYNAIHPHEGSLTVAYELFMTSEKQNALVDCLAICGNELVGYISDKKSDPRFAADHLKKMMRADGFRVNVHMMTDLEKFTDRLDSLNEHADSYRQGLTFKPDPAYRGYGREDMIRHYVLSICL